MIYQMTQRKHEEDPMFYSKQMKARLIFTYLKDKAELFLDVKPRSTNSGAMIYRRAPSDAAMNHRIQTLLDSAQVMRSNTEIWILLYPPEIYTTTIYVPSNSSEQKVREIIRDEVWAKLSYPFKYDWENYLIKRLDNGYGQDMVTVTILGKNVIPRIRSLLYKNLGKVIFIGDGLQFLNVDETQFPQIRGQIYEVILPYDEIFYRAVFRSGIHIESQILTHANSECFGHYHLLKEQVYLDLRKNRIQDDLPQIQPIVSKEEWIEALLSPAAFPTWLIARNSLKQQKQTSFIKLFQAEGYQSSYTNFSSKVSINF